MPMSKLRRGLAPLVNGNVVMPVCATMQEFELRHPGMEPVKMKRSGNNSTQFGPKRYGAKKWKPE